MQKPHNELHPVELLLLAGMALLWALWTVARLVLVPALALLLSLCCRASTDGTAPALTATPEAPAPEPLEAPAAPVTDGTATAPKAPAAPALAQLAEQAAATLQPLTVAQLRAQARAAGLPRTLTRTGRRAALLEALSWAEVALI
jgi:hypothetical protein